MKHRGRGRRKPHQIHQMQQMAISAGFFAFFRSLWGGRGPETGHQIHRIKWQFRRFFRSLSGKKWTGTFPWPEKDPSNPSNAANGNSAGVFAFPLIAAVSASRGTAGNVC